MNNWKLLITSTLVALMASEVAIRFMIDAWPFEYDIYRPEDLSDRDQTLLWRFSPTQGRNRLGLRNREEVDANKEGRFRNPFPW
jgi:hypothetical protein